MASSGHPLSYFELRSVAYFNEDSGVEGVHDGEGEKVVEYAGDDLQSGVGRVFRLADVLRHRANAATDKVMPADYWYYPE